jgi:hypothetical protein
LVFAAYTTRFKYVESTVDPTNQSEILFAKANISFQIAFYGAYFLAGVMRYFFILTLAILRQYKQIASIIDQDGVQPA